MRERSRDSMKQSVSSMGNRFSLKTPAKNRKLLFRLRIVFIFAVLGILVWNAFKFSYIIVNHTQTEMYPAIAPNNKILIYRHIFGEWIYQKGDVLYVRFTPESKPIFVKVLAMDSGKVEVIKSVLHIDSSPIKEVTFGVKNFNRNYGSLKEGQAFLAFINQAHTNKDDCLTLDFIYKDNIDVLGKVFFNFSGTPSKKKPKNDLSPLVPLDLNKHDVIPLPPSK